MLPLPFTTVISETAVLRLNRMIFSGIVLNPVTGAFCSKQQRIQHFTSWYSSALLDIPSIMYKIPQSPLILASILGSA